MNNDELIKLRKNTLEFIKLISIIIVLIILILILSFKIVIRNSIILDIGKSKEIVNYNDKYVLDEGSASIFNKKLKVKHYGKFNNSKIGNYKIKYTTNYLGIKKEKIKEISIIDKDKPNIKLNGNNEIYLYINSNYIEDGASAYDLYDKDLTSNIKIEGKVDTSKTGNYIIKYSVSDSSNNKNYKERRVYVIDNPKKVIYLTFDDGPNDKYSPKVLELLKKYNAYATFFVTCSGSDSIIKKEYDLGHSIGLHTCSHKYDIYSSIDTYFSDLEKIENRVYNIIGKKTKLIRFPGGSSNTISKRYNDGIMSNLVNLVEEKGYIYFDWNISSGDAGDSKDPDVIYNNVISKISNDKVNIVLMHDRSSYTVDALDKILKWGKSNGYVFLGLNENVISVHHKVNN